MNILPPQTAAVRSDRLEYNRVSRDLVAIFERQTMKAVMANEPEHILESRRRTGADQWDEMWEGVLHIAPSPNRDHQDFEGSLEFWLRLHWAQHKSGRVYHQINVSEPGTWPNNYRIPDLVLLTPPRFDI